MPCVQGVQNLFCQQALEFCHNHWLQQLLQCARHFLLHKEPANTAPPASVDLFLSRELEKLCRLFFRSLLECLSKYFFWLLHHADAAGLAGMASGSYRPCAARCCAYQPRTVWASKGMPVIREYCSQTRRYCSSEIELPSAPAIPLGIPLAGPLDPPPAPCTMHSGERQSREVIRTRENR